VAVAVVVVVRLQPQGGEQMVKRDGGGTG